MTDRHTALDYAQVLKILSDRHFPGSSKILLLEDNLSTYKSRSLYEAFPDTEAQPSRRAVRMALDTQVRQLAGYG